MILDSLIDCLIAFLVYNSEECFLYSILLGSKYEIYYRSLQERAFYVEKGANLFKILAENEVKKHSISNI